MPAYVPTTGPGRLRRRFAGKRPVWRPRGTRGPGTRLRTVGDAMVEWEDRAIVLSARPYGENKLIVQLLTAERGRHAGLAYGSARTQGAVLQTGNLVLARWRGRLAEQLGTVGCELSRAHAGHWLGDAPRLTGIAAGCAIVEASLPEREPHAPVFAGLETLLGSLDNPAWPASYVAFELALLADAGFGLDLTRCAATGATEDLIYVSPRTGRAVSRTAGEPYAERLLVLPGFLRGDASLDSADIRAGLALTGYFMERHILRPANRPLPASRLRLAECFSD